MTCGTLHFCGSCAVLRRSALEEMSGLPLKPSPDAHTALKCSVQTQTTYINIPQAAGLATDVYRHMWVKIRWAQGWRKFSLR